VRADHFSIDPDASRAETLPAAVYGDPGWHRQLVDRVLARSWQLVADSAELRVPGHHKPVVFLEGSVNEPLLLTRDRDDKPHCLSNVCTHRGMLVAEHEGTSAFLRCRYHGRRFDLDGRFASMPEFEEVECFPRPSDSLPQLALESWGRLWFSALDPAGGFANWIGPVRERLGWWPWSQLEPAPDRDRDYLIGANWLLYCDNYLEGFHIPYVHAGLAGAIDYGAYTTELFEQGSLQLAVAASGEPAFDLPASSPDFGQRIAAYYYFLNPNLMLNFYPWGLSANIVKPLSADRTRVSYRTWVWRPDLLGEGAGAALDRVEREDEAIVEAVQRGCRSRLYHRGRYSVKRERGVHHFHRFLAEALARGLG
jgi:choline monooxygenase